MSLLERSFDSTLLLPINRTTFNFDCTILRVQSFLFRCLLPFKSFENDNDDPLNRETKTCSDFLFLALLASCARLPWILWNRLLCAVIKIEKQTKLMRHFLPERFVDGVCCYLRAFCCYFSTPNRKHQTKMPCIPHVRVL